MTVRFDDVDKLVVEKWAAVSELVEAHAAVERKVRDLVDETGTALAPWTKGHLGFNLETRAKDGEFWLVKPEWRLSEDKDVPVACLVLGGFTASVAFAADDRFYACVYCHDDKSRGYVRTPFREALLAEIGPARETWATDTDKTCPLNQYLEPSAREVITETEKFQDWVRHQLTWLAEQLEEPVSRAFEQARTPTAR